MKLWALSESLSEGKAIKVTPSMRRFVEGILANYRKGPLEFGKPFILEL